MVSFRVATLVFIFAFASQIISRQTDAQEQVPSHSDERLAVARIMADKDWFKRYEEFGDPQDYPVAVERAIRAHFASRYNQLEEAEILLAEARDASALEGFPTENFVIVLDLLQSRLWERQQNYEALLSSPIFESVLLRTGRENNWEVGLEFPPRFLAADSSSTMFGNVASNKERIIVEGYADRQLVRVMLDTGAGETSLFLPDDDIWPIIRTSRQVEVRKPGYGGSIAQLVVLENLDIGGSVFQNITAIKRLDESHPLVEGSKRHHFDILLGAREILKFGGLSMEVAKGKVVAASLGKPSFSGLDTGPPNLLIRDSIPFIRVEIGERTYACVFDTGAGVSFISSDLFSQNNESEGWRRRRNTVRRMMFKAGGRNISLRDVQIKDWKNPGCLIGLDAVVASGGVDVDFEIPRIQFGSLALEE